MNQGYATGGPEHARRLLENLVRNLAAEHPGAAVSLREGLDETLTVMRLGLPASLERVLSSTNLIENLFSRVRDVGRGVKLWQGGNHGAEMDYGGVCSKLSAERPVDALKLSRASGILIEKLAGESFDESGHELRRGADPAKQS